MAANDKQMEVFFKALADRTRLRLLHLMGDDEICVCFLVEALRVSQPKISRHLAYLRRAGVVEARREGKWMHYRIAVPPDPGAARVLSETLLWLEHEKAMQADRIRLNKACCSPQRFVTLLGAPVPAPAAPVPMAR